MLRNIRITSLACLCVLFLSCAPSRFVRTIPKGQTQISGTLGGPMQNLFGMTIPTPFTSIGVGHGLKEDLTLFGGLHTTALVFKTLQLDLGATKRLYQADSSGFIPSVSGSFSLNGLVDLNEGENDIYPQIDLNAYWNYGKNKKHFFYMGIGTWADLQALKAHDEVQETAMLFNPHIGTNLALNKWNITLEYKVLGLGQSNQNVVVNYAKWHGNRSVPGIFVGVAKTIN